jgi:hypothetical protein
VIVYNLLCENAHRFEGWFASPEAFSEQDRADQLMCPVCGSSRVTKQPSAPHVQTRVRQGSTDETVMADPGMLEQIRRRVVDYILRNTEDVGERFADEARAIFSNEAPERAIRGKTTPEEAEELREEGIEVFVLPVASVPPDRLH